MGQKFYTDGTPSRELVDDEELKTFNVPNNLPTGCMIVATINGIPIVYGQPSVILSDGTPIHLEWK